jgi:hypothetical protein
VKWTRPVARSAVPREIRHQPAPLPQFESVQHCAELGRVPLLRGRLLERGYQRPLSGFSPIAAVTEDRSGAPVAFALQFVLNLVMKPPRYERKEASLPW